MTELWRDKIRRHLQLLWRKVLERLPRRRED
jgi:hypothetical protein